MYDTADRAIAVVGLGAILPDAPDVATFWQNLSVGRYSISEVPADRWDVSRYYDPDPHAPERSYSKIGGWVKTAHWDPIAWKLPIPPKVSDAMDGGQRWAVACTRQALLDYGFPARPLDAARTAIILGNAMAGEKHYATALRVFFPEFERALREAPNFESLPPAVRDVIVAESRALFNQATPPITEDTMPGELSNCIAGRIANLFDFHGPNYVVDAACASAMAAMSAAVEGLVERDFDVAITGGVDRNMGASAFVKFCKIGALSATGTRPYADGADGFVMGEGAALFILKRLADAERDGDKIYAVLRGLGGSSDGKGKGITAPNPIGQKLAVERAWDNARLSPDSCSLVEGHGTSTRVGDVVEVESLTDVFLSHGAKPQSVALGSVKSNIGHLKAAAGAAGLLKLVLALHHKKLPPSLGFAQPNPNIDFARSPFVVNTTLRDWESRGEPRRAGLSAFGFGGTNFHAVLEDHEPGRLTKRRASVVVPGLTGAATAASYSAKSPLRGVAVLGAADAASLVARISELGRAAAEGRAPAPSAPAATDLAAPVRVAIDFGGAPELADKCQKAAKALKSAEPAALRMLRQQGVYFGRGQAGKVAFLYTGQGSQYVGMLSSLRKLEPLVATVFAEADRVMTPLLGRPLSRFIFIDESDATAKARAEEDLRQTAITQPAILATDMALTRLLSAYGVYPDMVMGHSLGEYGALVAAGALPFADALQAVSARGQEMTRVSVADNGWMVAVTAPLAEIQRAVEAEQGYAVVANLNSRSQAVIGGASDAVERVMHALEAKGFTCVRLPVSHAFHTAIVAPASEPLREVLERLHVTAPELPCVANVTGKFYPTAGEASGDVRRAVVDLLAKQVAAPVQFVEGLETLYAAGARVFVEVGPKKALAGFVDDVLGDRGDVAAIATNHPKQGDLVSFNQALAALYAAGLGAGRPGAEQPAEITTPKREIARATEAPVEVVVTGAALGLPGTARVFDDENIDRILRGQGFVDVIPTRIRRAILDKRVTRVVKGADGSGSFQTITDPDEVIRLAARANAFDLAAEFGVGEERIPALDITTKLAIAAGLDALRDAGLPLVRSYRTTSKGTKLPDRWMLPAALRDDTGIIFASAFPGYDAFAEDLRRYYASVARREQLELIRSLEARVESEQLKSELAYKRVHLEAEEARDGYVFDRRFLFRILAMGHSQFAELIGARGPNTQVNAACASTTQALSIAQDWLEARRCRRVVVIAADNVTSDNLLEWMGAGFLSTGAAATDDVVENAALPFDRRRHGMLLGMGAAAIVVESREAAAERGLAPICRLVASITSNSAFHGTRLDVEHIGQVMERLVARSGLDRAELASRMVFVSHETYTPARGGSASAEIHALRQVFGEAAKRILIANTKGFTGHPMGVGIEDVVAIKSLEAGVVPPVPNFHEVDPELGELSLSRGGPSNAQFALRLAAGFGSQISMALLAWEPTADGKHRDARALGYGYRLTDPSVFSKWMARVSEDPSAELEVVARTLRVKDKLATRAEPTAPAPTPRVAPAAPAPVALPAPAPVVPAAPAPKAAPAASALKAAPIAPVVPAAAPAPVANLEETVRAKVLAIVAAQTGYPEDMLDLDLDLEADLGVDTVKQAETFAAVRAAYSLPREEKLRLRDFPTLAHVVKFVLDRLPAAPAPAPAPAAPAPVAPAPVAPAPVASLKETVRVKVLAIVAAQTGYPEDMLDLDLDLEADLGVDTVKQAETFAAVRAAYSLPREEKLRLRDFPTLAHVVKFVLDRVPAAQVAPAAPAPVAPASVAAPAPIAPAAPAPVADLEQGVRAKVLAIVAAQTGYPEDMLDLDLDLEADLGVDTVKQAETFAAVRAAYSLPREEKLRLRDFPTLAHVVKFVLDRLPAAPAAPSPRRPRRSLRPRLRLQRRADFVASPCSARGRRSRCAKRPASSSARARVSS
ncbi:MAG: beta-ketoacyl synthase N-terminal-like domain-containing protein [Polyangiaceae bacterium]